jgi:hypothetical protein
MPCLSINKVLRQMLPDASGVYISNNWKLNDSMIVYLHWNHNLPSTAKLGVVAFLQDATGSREVYQTAYVRGTGFQGSYTAVVEPQNELGEVSIYPVPVSEQLNIKFLLLSNEAHRWEIYNSLGEQVLVGITAQGSEEFKVNTNMLNSGIYSLKIENNNNIIIKKFIIVR